MRTVRPGVRQGAQEGEAADGRDSLGEGADQLRAGQGRHSYDAHRSGRGVRDVRRPAPGRARPVGEDRHRGLENIIRDRRKELPGSAIIYTLTVAAAEEITAYLRQCGHTVASYTGRTENADRQQAEDDLLANRVKALVATSALGMGFDKPDLGFVVHLGPHSSPIAYYQQVGRAGRGVEHAEVLLLPGKEDEAIWQYFASVAFPRRSRSGAPSTRSPRQAARSRCRSWNRWSTCGAPVWRPCSRSSTSTGRSGG